MGLTHIFLFGCNFLENLLLKREKIYIIDISKREDQYV